MHTDVAWGSIVSSLEFGTKTCRSQVLYIGLGPLYRRHSKHIYLFLLHCWNHLADQSFLTMWIKIWLCVCSWCKQVNDGFQCGKWNPVRVIVAAVYPRHTAALNNLLSATSCRSELYTPTLSPTPRLSFGKENIIFISSSKQFQCRFIKPQLLNESIPDELSPRSPACLWML